MAAKRYLIEATRVDGGSFAVVVPGLRAARGVAVLAAFSFAGHDAAASAARAFSDFNLRNARPVRITWEPALREWSVSMRELRK